MDIPEKYKKLWGEWDIRVLILISLLIQVILIFLGRLRKTSTSTWIRMLVWSSYLLADWVADYALGQLSNNMDDSSPSNPIIAFWAPFLILHLGGPDTITAYSMEDNELWARHLLGLSYELIIAFYVLLRSLPNTHLLVPTLLIFLVAIIKYMERSYSLYRASTESFRSSIGSSAKQLPTDISSATSKMEDLNALKTTFELYSSCRPFFVDVIPRVEVYEATGNLVKEMTTKEVLKMTALELSFAYDELYTKAVVNHSRTGRVLRALCSICILMAFLLYVLAPKDSFDKLDVAITYVLLGTSIILDAMAFVMLLFSDWMVVSLLNIKKLSHWTELLALHIVKIKSMWFKRRYWSREMPQLNLFSNCLKILATRETLRRRMINWIEEKLSLVQETKLFSSWTSGFETYTLCTAKPIQATEELQETIATFAQARLHISWDKFNEPAGLSALREVTSAPAWTIPTFVKLVEGLSLDQQVLLWHITTELCFHWKSNSLHPLHPQQPEIEVEDNNTREMKRISSEMEACTYLSNYMMHMVLMRPEMMSTMGGASPLVFWHACYDMVQFIRKNDGDHHLLTSNAKVDQICRMMMTTPIEWIRYSSLFEIARALAHMVLIIEEEERWQVVTTAWVELLMQGAKTTRASMHVKQLSKGGELLTFIWLLTKHVGMVDSLDIGAYMTGGALQMAIQLLPMIELYLHNQQ
ncbi:uncharacterized protein LOC110024508 [Phalaenopsis equestris]|uniref:uncharacterized protein LOC110024508 n=1 Tax=Phalaenopsis equestris TaxID=78828 RepID=UPI0009E4ABD7|nr:uncharacterized protein LOC110024508 [Phalaenopsis equestris]